MIDHGERALAEQYASQHWLASPLRPRTRTLRGGDHTLASAMFEAAMDGIMTFVPVRDDDGVVVDFEWTDLNPAVEHAIRQPSSVLIGQRLLASWPSEEMRLLVQRYIHVLETGEPLAMEVNVPRPDGAMGWYHVSSLRHQDGGDLGIVVITRDITEQRAYAELLAEVTRQRQTLERQALHDPLTGLANRLLLDERLQHALSRLARQTSSIAVMFLDVDSFKDVNDQHGHRVGDQVLIELARRLELSARPYDTVARLGGDEFVIVCEDVVAADVPRIAHRLLDVCTAPFDIGAHVLNVSSSIGVAIADDCQTHASSLIGDADTAMYRAKQAGGNRVEFTSETGGELGQRYEIEAALPAALERRDLQLRFEPIVNAPDLRVVGADVRIHWDHPDQGPLDHAVVSATAASAGLSPMLHRWMVVETIAELARGRDSVAPDPVVLVVDIADGLLRSEDFVSWLIETLAAQGVAPQRLCLGIDDDVLAHDDDALATILHTLDAHGILLGRIGVGRSVSPTRYATNHPVRYARIADGLVGMLNAGGSTIIRTIVEIAGQRDRTVVAGGVTDRSQSERLEQLGVRLLQGPYYGGVLTGEQLKARVRDHRTPGP